MFLLKYVKIQTNKFSSAIENFIAFVVTPLWKLWNFLSFWGVTTKAFTVVDKNINQSADSIKLE